MEKGLFWDVPFFIHTPAEGWLKSEPSNGCWCPLKTEVERVHLSAPLSASLKKKSTPPYFPIRKPSLGAIADKKWNVLFLRNIRLNITMVPPLTRSLMGQKNLAVITRWPRVSVRVSLRENVRSFLAGGPKKVAVITSSRWLYYQGGRKAGFHCI